MLVLLLIGHLLHLLHHTEMDSALRHMEVDPQTLQYNFKTVVALIESGRFSRVYHSYPGLEYPQIITQIQSDSQLNCVRNST